MNINVHITIGVHSRTCKYMHTHISLTHILYIFMCCTHMYMCAHAHVSVCVCVSTLIRIPLHTPSLPLSLLHTPGARANNGVSSKGQKWGGAIFTQF